MKHTKTNKNRGFTLIELLVVISIIGLLSSVVLASLNSARDKARVSAVRQSMRQLQLAMEVYKSDNGYYPLEDFAFGIPELDTWPPGGWVNAVVSGDGGILSQALTYEDASGNTVNRNPLIPEYIPAMPQTLNAGDHILYMTGYSVLTNFGGGFCGDKPVKGYFFWYYNDAGYSVLDRMIFAGDDPAHTCFTGN